MWNPESGEQGWGSMEQSMGFSLPKEKRSGQARVDRACLGVIVILLVPLATGRCFGAALHPHPPVPHLVKGKVTSHNFKNCRQPTTGLDSQDRFRYIGVGFPRGGYYGSFCVYYVPVKAVSSA